MTTTTQFALTTTQILVGAVLAISSILAFALPSQAHAATYAFVNTSGDVSIVSANDPVSAMATAFNIALHSGVMLLQSQTDAFVGFHVNL
ncbi:MAG: hypothetical protein AAB472_02715 [Patescibacteria group bacterium]